MMRTLMAAAFVVAGPWVGDATADEAIEPMKPAADAPPGCAGHLDEATVVRCALAASPEVRQTRAELEAIAGRRAIARVALPSNPVLGATLSARRRPLPEPASVTNWTVTLSQELEIAGQRGARVDVVDAQSAAQARRVEVAEQEVAAGALAAYHEAVAAQEAVRLAGALAQTAETLAAYAEARLNEALVAGVEADVARAEATRMALTRLEAERRLGTSRATLALLLDVDPRGVVLPDAVATVVPSLADDEALTQQALRLRGELGAAQIERQVLERRLTLVRRERVPNPTLSAFWERGEINDRIIGVGLSVPLPLPAPVGRTRAGELDETRAQLRAAESAEALVRRRVRLEVAQALATFRARQGAAALFGPEMLARARADLASLRVAIAGRQLALREGLQWQRSLIELLQADIETRLGRALAWVDLRRAAALPLGPSPAGGQGAAP